MKTCKTEKERKEIHNYEVFVVFFFSLVLCVSKFYSLLFFLVDVVLFYSFWVFVVYAMGVFFCGPGVKGSLRVRDGMEERDGNDQGNGGAEGKDETNGECV